MLIGLISDTHIPDPIRELPAQLKEVFHGVDLILHAGDIYAVSVLDELELRAPVLAAEGDDDLGSTASDRRVERKHILNVDGVTIWLAHLVVWSWPPFISGAPPDVMVFGHTHEASLLSSDGVLQVNPGSATFPHYSVDLGSVGMLKNNSGKAEAQIIQLQ